MGPPKSDEEEDWEIWMSGSFDDRGRQGMSKDSGSEDEEVRRRSGLKVWSGREMSGASGVVEGVSEGIKTTVCVY